MTPPESRWQSDQHNRRWWEFLPEHRRPPIPLSLSTSPCRPEPRPEPANPENNRFSASSPAVGSITGLGGACGFGGFLPRRNHYPPPNRRTRKQIDSRRLPLRPVPSGGVMERAGSAAFFLGGTTIASGQTTKGRPRPCPRVLPTDSPTAHGRPEETVTPHVQPENPRTFGLAARRGLARASRPRPRSRTGESENRKIIAEFLQSRFHRRRHGAQAGSPAAVLTRRCPASSFRRSSGTRPGSRRSAATSSGPPGRFPGAS